jgi:hypothetical protein
MRFCFLTLLFSKLVAKRTVSVFKHRFQNRSPNRLKVFERLFGFNRLLPQIYQVVWLYCCSFDSYVNEKFYT